MSRLVMTPSKGARHLFELRKRRVLIDVRHIERLVGLRSLEARHGAVVVGVLFLALLLGDDALRRIAPALEGGAAELRLSPPHLYLRRARPQLRFSGGELRIQIRGLDQRQHLAAVHRIADVDEPLADVAVDTRINGACMPGGGLAWQHQALHRAQWLRTDHVHRRRRAAGGRGVARDSARLEVAVEADADECHGQHDDGDNGGALQARLNARRHTRRGCARLGRGHIVTVVGLAGFLRRLQAALLAGRAASLCAAAGTWWARRSAWRRLRTAGRRSPRAPAARSARRPRPRRSPSGPCRGS